MTLTDLKAGTVETLRVCDTPGFTMLLPVSRPWALDRWVDHFQQVVLPWGDIELLVAVDTDDPRVYDYVRSVFASLADRLAGLSLRFSGLPPLGEAASPGLRRGRIAHQWRWFLTSLRGEYVLGAEDDTLPDPRAYVELLRVLRDHEADFAQATIVGRWNSRMVPHWHVREVNDGLPTVIETGWWREGDPDVVEIHGGGWYCFAAKTEAICGLGLRFEEQGPLGPDVMWIWDLTQRGGKAVGVWSLGCIHFGHGFELHPRKGQLHQVVHTRTPLGTWIYQQKNIGPIKGALAQTAVGQEGDEMEKVLFEAGRSLRIEGEMLYTGSRMWIDPLRARQLEAQGIGKVVKNSGGGQIPAPMRVPLSPDQEVAGRIGEVETGQGGGAYTLTAFEAAQQQMRAGGQATPFSSGSSGQGAKSASEPSEAGDEDLGLDLSALGDSAQPGPIGTRTSRSNRDVLQRDPITPIAASSRSHPTGAPSQPLTPEQAAALTGPVTADAPKKGDGAKKRSK